MFDSKKYWTDRYESGLTSGNGSYGFLAEYKSNFINQFIIENNIKSLIEYGCGDGNQLSKLKCDKIIGVDVSEVAIEKCKRLIPNAEFYLLTDNNFNFNQTDLLLSLDVLYHLIEDNVYEAYIENILKHNSKFVIIYAPNFEDDGNFAKHVKPRKFSEHRKLKENYDLLKFEKNKFPSLDHTKGSFSDWYIFKSKNN